MRPSSLAGGRRPGARHALGGLILLSLLTAMAPSEACARKKLIEFGWDEPGPAFMREHIAEMEATPFDGCVYHLDYTRPDSSTGNFTWECWGRRAFTEEELQKSLDDLKATRFERFQENFLRFNTTPADLDWFDDYSAVISNARLAARIAREAGSRGILLDPEHYKEPLFEYRKQRDAKTKSWADYAAQARRRGREVMEALQEGFPGLTVFLAFGYSWPMSEIKASRFALPDCKYGLLAPFLDGMLEAAEGGTRMVDGFELAYGFNDPRRIDAAYRLVKVEGLAIVADPAKYERVFSFSFGIWLDFDWRKHGWHTDDPDRNYRSPEDTRAIVRKALQTADEYVWIYSETPRWWSEERRSLKLPSKYVEALRGAKQDAARE